MTNTAKIEVIKKHAQRNIAINTITTIAARFNYYDIEYSKEDKHHCISARNTNNRNVRVFIAIINENDSYNDLIASAAIYLYQSINKNI